MESNMVKMEDNKPKWSELNVKTVKDFFYKNLPEYILEHTNTYGPYWNIMFSKKDIRIEIRGDIGFNVKIWIAEDPYDLWQYDRRVVDKTETSNENILYQLNVLKRFLLD